MVVPFLSEGPARWERQGCLLADSAPTVHNVQFVKYDVTVSFMAQVLDTVAYLVPQVLDTAS